MAFVANTAFEVKVTNASRNGTQNVAGKFGTGAGTSFVAQDCSAGWLCVRNALIPNQGYESVVDTSGNPRILNGNTWYFNQATGGTVEGRTGDHTGIFASNTYDVNKVGSGDLQYNLGVNTLGLGVPAGNRSDFTELIVGEQYKWGAGNFSALPQTGEIYATIVNGQWTPTSTLPAGGTGVYGKILRTEPFNEATTFFGTGYILEICRTAQAAQAA